MSLIRTEEGLSSFRWRALQGERILQRTGRCWSKRNGRRTSLFRSRREIRTKKVSEMAGDLLLEEKSDYVNEIDVGCTRNFWNIQFWRKLQHVKSYGVNVRHQVAVQLGTWRHVCYTWSLATRAASVYYDGLLIGSLTTPSGKKLGLDGYIVLGNEFDSYGGGFQDGNHQASWQWSTPSKYYIYTIYIYTWSIAEYNPN